MSSVISIRLSAALERTIRQNAADSNMTVPAVVRWILQHALDSQFTFSALPNPRWVLNAKLDVRLPSELVARVYQESQRLNISISVYSRVILLAIYTKRLIIVDIGGVTRLAENYAQKKSA
jgi:hypothetical protein